jgi:hypothetical protein
MAQAQPNRSGRHAFDKTVSSEPLAFAADAAAMGLNSVSVLWYWSTTYPGQGPLPCLWMDMGLRAGNGDA